MFKKLSGGMALVLALTSGVGITHAASQQTTVKQVTEKAANAPLETLTIRTMLASLTAIPTRQATTLDTLEKKVQGTFKRTTNLTLQTATRTQILTDAGTKTERKSILDDLIQKDRQYPTG